MNAPALEAERLRSSNTQGELRKLKTGIDRLAISLSETSNSSIGDVLQIVKEFGIADLGDPLGQHLAHFKSGINYNSDDNYDDDDARERRTIEAFFSTPARQLWEYQKYIEDLSPFATQQGIKGAEFKRVVSILDDEEGTHSHFSYNKFFGIEELSDTDKDNIEKGKDNVIERTRRLFYVCCSRAQRDLAVIFFVEDVAAAKTKVLDSKIFPETDVIILD